MPDLTTLKAANAARWVVAKPTRNYVTIAKSLVAAKAHYQAVEEKTGVPWHFIAVVHERESSQSWTASLAQGDPWNKVSTHVPVGRGPFSSWGEAAIDALVSCPPYAARNKDWSPGGTLTLLEQYNGLGYFRMNRPSPYIWSGTDQYVSGKYVADGKYDPNAIDKQPGCAALLKAMMAIDPSITLGAAKPVSAPTVPAPDRPVPVPAPQGNWLSALLSILASIFRRK